MQMRVLTSFTTLWLSIDKEIESRCKLAICDISDIKPLTKWHGFSDARLDRSKQKHTLAVRSAVRVLYNSDTAGRRYMQDDGGEENNNNLSGPSVTKTSKVAAWLGE